MSEHLLLPPNGECLDLNELKLHLRITDDSQDSLLSGYVSAARQAAEMKTRNQLLHARWLLVLDQFPRGGYGTPLPFLESVNIPAYAILLPHCPVVAVESITYLDTSGVQQTVDPAIYTVNNVITPGLITPRFGQIWPIPLPEIGSVRVTYTAGYASPYTIENGKLSVQGPVTWAVNSVVQLYTSGGADRALPAPLRAQTNYMIATAEDGGLYTLKTMGGVPVEITSNGTGTHYLGIVPESIRSWIKLRVGSLYQNREEVAVLSRGTLADLPFVDGLLDPYRISMP